MENDLPLDPLERAILFTRNRASVARRTGFTAMAADLDSRADAVEKLRTVAVELARELRDMREHMIDRGHTDETSDGIQAADEALVAFAQLNLK